MKHLFLQLNNNFKGITLAIAGFSAFAISDATSKWLSHQYEPLQVVGMNALFAMITILVFAPFLGGLSNTLKTKKLHIHAGRSACNIILSILIVIAFSKLSLIAIYTLLFITPFVTTLLAIPIYKERVDKHGWIAIAIGFAGVLVVLRPGISDINQWLFLPLSMTLFVSILFLLARKLPNDETLLSLAFFPILTNFVIITPITFILYKFPPISHIFAFVICGITVVFGLICTTCAFRIAKASIISPIHYSQILWGIGFGYFLFEDIPDMWTLIGSAIIISSGIYLIEIERRRIY